MSHKKFQIEGNIIVNENDKTTIKAVEVSEIFNDFFISTVSEIGYNETIVLCPWLWWMCLS